jgi:hypothetical protein
MVVGYEEESGMSEGYVVSVMVHPHQLEEHTCPLKPKSPVILLLRGLTLGLPHALLARWRGIGSSNHEGTERRESR